MHAAEFRLMAQYAAVHWWYVTKRALLEKIFQQFILRQKKSKLQILDLGSGTGSNWQTLQKFGAVTGVEQSSIGVKFCKALGWKKIIQSSIQDFKFPKKSFDVVTILDVLYHKKIKSDVSVLNQIYKTLKPGGWLIVTDSAGPEWFGPHDISNEARERYTLSEMAIKTQSAGFSVRHSSYFYATTFLLFMISRTLEKIGWLSVEKTETPPPTLLNQLLIWLMRFEVKLATQATLPFGSSVLVVAQKSQK